jgi:hypothetical protein
MKLRSRVVAAAMTAFALLTGGAGPVRADNELAASRSTFYIVAPGSDNSIPPIVHALTDRLQSLFDRTAGAGTVWVIPRLSWATSDLQSQCANDPGKDQPNGPQVLGGLILEGTNTYMSTDPLVFWTHGWAKVSTNAELVSCKPTGHDTPTITWVSNDLHGYGSRNGIAFETVTATTLAFALPNTDAKSIALGVAFGGASGASTIPPVNDSLTTHDAAARVVDDLMRSLNDGCSTSNPDIKPMCAKLGLPGPLPTPHTE